ncbi:PREDICTED: uncharacterized protein LOC104589907 isoform X2 [Nelumbo nucifera]|uniref:Uncharacterized protein LOC104589907 isoform X2 n=2 Tax=Nelumbo nucifera TaxID=4432 RepID=A0A1U7ZF74_NELNU|nr:PREDICTED: uncharacterized protein LOC104589907 isoform X2 [Nelumbo nucifera]DAD32756.1 TPA_asm: hypothetical protein HUJ06_011607 [Nelumbo nucifera]
MENGIGIIEGFIRQKSITSLFRSGRKSEEETSDDFSKPIPQLSPIANSVVSRCSKILQIPTEELQHCFETQLPEHAQHVSTYARNLLEFCSYQALNVLTQRPDYLSDKEFSLLTYDMMLAWEDPGVKSEPEPLHKGDESCNVQENENEDGWSFFYSNSTNMAVQVDDKKTVGPEAFARIAPACAAVADIITVHNLFEALTSSSGGQLHFFIYNKYLGSLDKVIKNAKSASGLPLASSLTLAEGEVILDVDGCVPTQPVLQHTGISAWPGRLTLTNYALYFESLGVGLYEKAVRYDLATDLKQIIKPELTGPLGARLFDKALMYKSTAIPEPVYLEFPEFKGSSRRDYWLEISLEILYAHKFIRKYKLKHTQQAEALAKAILGIYRYHAVRDAFHICPSHYKTLLAYNLAEKLPGGDTILETLSRHLEILNSGMSQDDAIESSSVDMKRQPSLSLVSFITLTRLGFMLPKLLDVEVEAKFLERDIWVGKINPLELAVKQLKCNTGRAEAAQETVNQVKVEGIDTNIAVMKELLFPVVELFQRLQFLASWDDPFKSAMFLVVICYTIFRYIIPCIFVSIAAFMIWHKFCNKGKPLEAFIVTAPPTRNAVEQLLSLQEAISQFETLVQAGNIILLKLRALLFGALPQATDKAVVFFIIMAAVFAFVPLWFLIMIVFLEAFTREMPLRKDLSDRWLRRVREWWIGIPAAPVQLIKLEDKKRK